MTGFARIIRIGLVLLLCFDAALLLGRRRAQSALDSLRSPFPARSRAAALPQGFLPDGTAYTPPSKYKCALLSYSAEHCQYCTARIPLQVQPGGAAAQVAAVEAGVAEGADP